MTVQECAAQQRQANKTFLAIGLTLFAGVAWSFWQCVS